jgi:hypothetical protein
MSVGEGDRLPKRELLDLGKERSIECCEGCVLLGSAGCPGFRREEDMSLQFLLPL